MRISTKTIFESGMARMNELQSSLLKTQQQISTGRRILTPSDDPVASARALEVTQNKEINSQLALNRQSARASLNHQEGALQHVTSLLHDIKELAISAGNGVLDDTQRQFMATELRGQLQEMIGLANTRDGIGNFLFSGYQTSTQPFTQTATGAQYHGDQGQRMLQVGPARQLALSDSGDAIFDQILNGNGVFATAADAANTGSGIISPGTATSTGTLAASYKIVFSGGGTTYSVFDVTADPLMAGVPLQTGTYVSDQAISFSTVQVEIKGAPVDGDVFSIDPSTNQSMFTTIGNLIDLLDSYGLNSAGQAELSNGLNAANINLANSLDHVLTVRASVGHRLKELDSLDNSGEDRNIQYAQTLSELQDLDYVKAITELTQTQSTLEAAQKSFTQISGMSLFDYI